MNARFVLLFAATIFAASIPSVRAAIVLDYSNASPFFTNNSTAKAAVDAAAADINAVLDLSNLNAITNDSVSGSSGTSTFGYNFRYSYQNPNLPVPPDPNQNDNRITIDNTMMPANEIRIFVGAQSLGGNVLGRGGPGGTGIGISAGGSSAGWQAASDAALMNNQLRRGGGVGSGPVITSFDETLFIGGTTVDYDFEVGPTIGNLWFDNDTSTDWHFDHTTDVESGKADLYSVALHETLHAIGVGTAEGWNALVSGTDWLGSEAILVNGTGEGLVATDGAHIGDNVMSLTLNGGVSQEAVMTPSILLGSRKYLTELDVAFLRDLNYATVTAIPEPSSFAVIALVGAGICVRRRRSKAKLATTSTAA